MIEIAAARDYFPRGLIQPAGSFRFSIDALLLAAFAAHLAEPGPGTDQPRLLDLGCGCGVAAFGVLLQRPEFSAVGLDKQAPLLGASVANAARLGFSERYQALRADLETAAGLAELERIFAARPADLVIVNPPYRLPGQGRLPASPSRREALFGNPGNLAAFVRAAALALGPKGKVCLIFPCSRLAELTERLADSGLALQRQLLVYSRLGEAPFFSLLAAGKTASPAKADLTAELVLYQSGGTGPGGPGNGSAGLTEEALLFCPWLACNRKRA